MTTTTHKLTFSQVQQAVESDRNAGFCLACGEEASGVEPDAREYKCESCGELRVFGAEQILIMGAFNDDDEKPLIAESLSRAALDSGRMEIVHVGDSPSPEPAKKTPTVRALSVRQILAGGSRSEIRKELYEKTGLLTDGKILLNTRPEQPVSDSFVMMEKPCREVLTSKSKTIAETAGIVFEVIEQGGDEVSLTNFVDKDGKQLCRVQSTYLKTAEKMTKAKTWRYVKNDILPRIIGQDKDGRAVAAIGIVAE